MKLALILLAACGNQTSSEEQYVQNELVELKAALAARDEAKVMVDCISVTSSLKRLPKLASEIEPLCYVAAPRLLLENAVKDAKDAKAKHPELGDLNCMQLMASDAFKTIAKHPMNDAELKRLADEYTSLCPERVAKFAKP